MRKHYKIISSIVCLLLCVGMIAFGVYAASNVLVTLSSSVSFTPTNAKLKIFGGVYGCAEQSSSTSIKYYANNSGVGDDANIASEANDIVTFNTWNFGTTTFDGNYINENKETPDPIYFFIQLTNYVEREIQYKVTISSAFADNNINLSYGYYSLANDDEKLTTNPNTNGFWDITGTQALNVPLQETYINTITTGAFSTSNNQAVTAIPKSAAFTTTMIVIKVEVADADEDVANFEFEFTVTAV